MDWRVGPAGAARFSTSGIPLFLLSLTHVAVVAHRGGAKLRPENTLGAFDHAVALGADAIECDVHLSRDGEVVVIHDPTLERTTNARGLVREWTADELADVDAGFHFKVHGWHPYRHRGWGVPRLRDVLHRYPALPIIIELKGADIRLAERTIEVIHEARAGHRVVLGGFDHDMLAAARRFGPGVATGASRAEFGAAFRRAIVRRGPKAPGYRVLQVPYRLGGGRVLHRGFVRRARAAGVPVQVWVVNRPADMRRLIAWGVSAIISDRPDLARHAVDASLHAGGERSAKTGHS